MLSTFIKLPISIQEKPHYPHFLPHNTIFFQILGDIVEIDGARGTITKCQEGVEETK